MQRQSRKIVAPVVISVLIALYYLAIFRFLLYLPLPVFIKVALVVIPLAIIGTLIYVLLERIREIKSGEEDDLNKY